MLCGCLSPTPIILAWALKAVAGLMEQSGLKLNQKKSLRFCIRAKGGESQSRIRLPTLDSVLLVLTWKVRSLGVTLDATLSEEAELTAVARSAYYDL